MGYRELIKQVQMASGFSNAESKDALEATVESISLHLNDGERKDFASQLPQELQDIALAVMPTEEHAKQDIIEQVMEAAQIEEARAKKQILSAWQALKNAISDGEIRHIRAQLSARNAELLY